jgi:fumarate hydratase class II
LAIRALRGIPVGIAQTGLRRERDSRGSADVPADRYWGAGTQRALSVIVSSDDRIPERFYRCYGYTKHAAAIANESSGLLQPWKREAISAAAADLIEGGLTDHFPLSVRQSGSGLETDINVNEVLANRAIQLLGGVVGSRAPVHPAKDVNLAQAALTTFTIAMHIAIVTEIETGLVPKAAGLASMIEGNAERADHGGWSRMGYAYRLRQSLRRIDEAEGDMHEVFLGEVADGGISAWSPQNLETFAHSIAMATRRPFIVAANTSPEACSLDAAVAAMAAVRGLAVTLQGIVESVGLAASSAVSAATGATAAACQTVIAEDGRVIAGGGASLPAIVQSVLDSIRVLGDACETARPVFAGPAIAARGRAGDVQR